MKSGNRFKLLPLLFFFVMLFVGYRVYDFWSPGFSSLQTKFFEIRTSMSAVEIAEKLKEDGVIRNPRFFLWYGRLTGDRKNIKAGEYKLNTRMTPGEVYSVITSGVSVGHPLTIPEGYNLFQIADLIEAVSPGGADQFIKLTKDKAFIARAWAEIALPENPAPPSTGLEGYLFPSTYYVSKNQSVKDIVRGMLRTYRTAFTSVEHARARELGFTEHQVVTLASIVEKETGAKIERGLVSSVFHNRLRKKMRLQSDPTVIYGIPNYDGNIRRKDLDAKTPYNTYAIPGLPVGPIANPGREAIQATLYPEASVYLYFVSRNDGTHEFTSTYEEHSKVVRKFQIDPKAREGKSWRDLKQN